MFNLVKLALLGFFFYLLYDFSTGFLSKRAQKAAAALVAPPAQHRDLNLTGSSGEGIVKQVVGAGGSRRRTRVGRGVI